MDNDKYVEICILPNNCLPYMKKYQAIKLLLEICDDLKNRGVQTLLYKKTGREYSLYRVVDDEDRKFIKQLTKRENGFNIDEWQLVSGKKLNPISELKNEVV